MEYIDGQPVIIEEPPYKAIFLAFGLLTLGTFLLTVGICIVTGAIDADYWWPNEGWKTQSLSFFVLGLLTFLPGSYVSYVSYCAYRGYPGYRFSHIPVHED